MKPGGVVSIKRLKVFDYFTKNKMLILMFFVFVLGLIFSSITFSGSKAALISDKLFKFYVSARRDSGFISIVFSALLEYLAVTLAFFVSGASVVGVILSPALCFSVGLYYGTLTSFTYSAFSLKGIAFNSVIIIPAALVFSLCVFFAAKEAFMFSSVLLRLTMPKSRPINVSGEFKIYCGKFFIVIILSILSALIDAVVSVSFIKFFSFI